jgi:hypothetical protein
MRLQVGKTYSEEYVSTYPRQRWRGRALCGCQVGPTSFSLLPLLLPPSPLLLPIGPDWTGGDSPAATLVWANPATSDRTPTIGGIRGASRTHTRKWRTLGRVGTPAPPTKADGGSGITRGGTYGYSGERVEWGKGSLRSWGSTGVARRRGGALHCSNSSGQRRRPRQPLESSGGGKS